MASFASTVGSKVASGVTRTVVWLRNDMRILDNPVLHEATKLHHPVLCVYCFDPRHYSLTDYGTKKTELYRAKFLIDSVKDLRQNLKSIDSNLLVSIGKPEDIIPTLCHYNNSIVLCQHEEAWEELQVQNALEKNLQKIGCGLNTFRGSTLIHRDDLPFSKNLGDMPDGFTPFKQKVEKLCEPRELIPAPSKGSLPALSSTDISTLLCNDKCSFDYIPSECDLGFSPGSFHIADQAHSRGGVMVFEGGETAGKMRLRRWMFDDDNLKDYFEIRNGM
jgi:deoxyribodipyrimidine photo-lyase